jgi:hypothetical protein
MRWGKVSNIDMDSAYRTLWNFLAASNYYLFKRTGKKNAPLTTENLSEKHMNNHNRCEM